MTFFHILSATLIFALRDLLFALISSSEGTIGFRVIIFNLWTFPQVHTGTSFGQTHFKFSCLKNNKHFDNKSKRRQFKNSKFMMCCSTCHQRSNASLHQMHVASKRNYTVPFLILCELLIYQWGNDVIFDPKNISIRISSHLTLCPEKIIISLQLFLQ